MEASIEQAVGMPTMPSNLTYKQRCALAKESGALYNRLYTHFSHDNVWDRLVTDASTRYVRSQSARPYKSGQGSLTNTGTLSGFTSNSTNPSAVYTTNSFKPNLSRSEHVIQVEALHPLVAKRFKDKHPIEYLASIRPDTETSTQTLRMMGTYTTDKMHADRMGVHIPHMSPGGTGWYHPDVTLTQRPSAEHPAWATTTSTFGFGPNVSWRPTRPQTAAASMQRTGYATSRGPGPAGVGAAQLPRATAGPAARSRPGSAVAAAAAAAAAKSSPPSAHVSFSFPAISATS